jgi:hypothetical protein
MPKNKKMALSLCISWRDEHTVMPQVSMLCFNSQIRKYEYPPLVYDLCSGYLQRNSGLYILDSKGVKKLSYFVECKQKSFIKLCLLFSRLWLRNRIRGIGAYSLLCH